MQKLISKLEKNSVTKGEKPGELKKFHKKSSSKKKKKAKRARRYTESSSSESEESDDSSDDSSDSDASEDDRKPRATRWTKTSNHRGESEIDKLIDSNINKELKSTLLNDIRNELKSSVDTNKKRHPTPTTLVNVRKGKKGQAIQWNGLYVLFDSGASE